MTVENSGINLLVWLPLAHRPPRQLDDLERKTFGEPRVRALLDDIRPLQADVTANDETDQALMAEFGVIGPPAILFFDRAGNELPAFRLVGFFEAEEFAQHLEKVLATP